MSIKKPVYGGTFPFPPSVNTYTACVRNRKIMSKKGREYKGKMALACKLQGLEGLLLNGRLSVHITLHPPDKRRRDISNYVKALEDCFTECDVWEDDSQIDHLTVVRGEKRKEGEAIVSIVEING